MVLKISDFRLKIVGICFNSINSINDVDPDTVDAIQY